MTYGCIKKLRHPHNPELAHQAGVQNAVGCRGPAGELNGVTPFVSACSACLLHGSQVSSIADSQMGT